MGECTGSAILQLPMALPRSSVVMPRGSRRSDFAANPPVVQGGAIDKGVGPGRARRPDDRRRIPALRRLAFPRLYQGGRPDSGTDTFDRRHPAALPHSQMGQRLPDAASGDRRRGDKRFRKDRARSARPHALDVRRYRGNRCRHTDQPSLLSWMEIPRRCVPRSRGAAFSNWSDGSQVAPRQAFRRVAPGANADTEILRRHGDSRRVCGDRLHDLHINAYEYVSTPSW